MTTITQSHRRSVTVLTGRAQDADYFTWREERFTVAGRRGGSGSGRAPSPD